VIEKRLKYSLDEIDFMRWATAVDEVLSHRLGCLYGVHVNVDAIAGIAKLDAKACGDCLHHLIATEASEKRNEEKLRTYMLNGTIPEELAKRILSAVKDGGYALWWPRELAAWYELFCGPTPPICTG
jgi:hypothetical protein